MPQIDVSEVLTDPYLAAEPYVVLRRFETVTSGGVVQIKVTRYNTHGNIQPVGQNSLMREEAFQTRTKTIKVYTNFMLRSASKAITQTYQPDLVLWKGDYYLVVTAEDFSQYGVGMVEAECSSVDYQDYAENTSVPWPDRPYAPGPA